MIIGLTGPTGSGKSLIAPAAETFGFRVIDCDQTARRAVRKGSPGLAALTKAFGNDILTPNGELDRKALALLAFSSPEKTNLLNQTLLPYIVTLALGEAGEGDVLFDAPTLFESGIDRQCDKTIAVLADRNLRLQRIMQRDGLTVEEANLRIHAGKPDSFYVKNADFVIKNNGDASTLYQQFLTILKKMTENR